MNRIIFIFLSAFLSLTLISCSKKDDSASSSSSTANTQTFVDSNFCRLTKNTSSRNSSLIVNDRKSDSRSSGRTGRDMYVDKSAVAQYETDDYLLIDEYDSTYSIDGKTYADGGTEGVNLSDNAILLGNTFTQELRFYYDPVGTGGGQLLGNESFRAPAISFHNHGKEIRYGFYTNNVVSGNRIRVTNLNFARAWHHIATTFDGTNYRLFLDGVEIDNSTAFQGLTPPNTERVNLIGKKPYLGKIDEVRIWDVARTQSQIQDNMNTTLVGMRQVW